MKYESVSLEEFIADTPVELIPAQTEEREWSAKPLGFERDGDLQPCPFCGSDNIRVQKEYDAYADCLDCGSRGPGSDNRTEAARLWNRRVR